MKRTNDAIAAIERRIGIPRPRGSTVARRLTEHVLLPVGAPGKAPQINRSDFVTLLIGLASDAPLSRVAETVVAYRNLTPAGTQIDALPESLQYTAGDYLDGLADEPANARSIKLEIVSSWPEIALHFSDGTARRFVAPGADASSWQARGYRRSTTINGAAFADAIADLFGEKS